MSRSFHKKQQTKKNRDSIPVPGDKAEHESALLIAADQQAQRFDRNPDWRFGIMLLNVLQSGFFPLLIGDGQKTEPQRQRR